MRKYILMALLSLVSMLTASAQGMSDSQVIDFVKREYKAGTSQSQIVTKLMQRGVNIDQIRRLRNQYDSQVNGDGRNRAASGAVSAPVETLRQNSDGTTNQELNTAKVGTTGEVEADASEDVDEVERDIEATSGISPDATGKRVFGRNIFRQRAIFEPNNNQPIPENYVLGPGDQVVIDIYGASQHTFIHTISPEGTITVSNYGPIYLSGMTVASAQAKLTKTIGSRYQSSDLRVTVGNTRSIMVDIMGEVTRPGTYRLSPFANVFYALYRAGGINSLGTLRNIKVYRKGRLVTVVDIYEYILNGRMTGNIVLQENDVIQVGTYDCLVGITGNVKRPMYYEMRKNESVSTLLKYAGGFTGDAHTKSVRLTRQTGERYQVYNVGEFDMANFRVADGDAVTVDGMINRYENMVEIKGAVFRPGQYQLGVNINSVKSLIEAAEGVTEDAFTTHGVLHRIKADRSLETVPVDVRGILEGTVADIPLQNEDVLFIMTKEDMRKELTLTITGQVMSPGTYEYADNTTIEDLIVMAGGLTDRASYAKVDVSRRIRDPYSTKKTNEIAKSFEFTLKDGLVIDGTKGFVLEPYDVVHVRRSPAYHTARNITVTGEVNYEGAFTLENKSMRLSDAIKLAGGVTEAAYLRGARLTRQMDDEERVRRRATREAIRYLMSDPNDSIAWSRMDLNDNTYVVGIYLDEAVAHPGSDKDILLREGDRLYIPEYTDIVKISGDVMFPNTLFYQEGMSVKKYVAQAGGYGHRAKKSKTFIVYQNGTVGLVKDGARPEPGCEIVVPSKRRREPINWGSIAQMGTSLTSIAALIIAITRL